MNSHNKLRQSVRESYAKVATANTKNSNSPCCNTANANTEQMSIKMGYSENDVTNVPKSSNMGLGCGNPKAIAALKAGETVLDLGSGGGFDCFLAADEVGKSGHVIGVDMTHEMLDKARSNAKSIKATNIDFRLGEIEHLPVADASVDVIISNCVINLSPEKQQVFKEAYRVLKANGRLAISDIVTTAELPQHILDDVKKYTACIAGALSIKELTKILETTGFRHITIEPKEESKTFIKEWAETIAPEDYIVSATIEAIK